jgi:DNA-binding transcriptional LysR family regulator
MDVESLEILVEVVRKGSFAAVARDRGVAASSISRTIASLEGELGIRLFQRNTRRVVPSEAGAIYLDRAQPAIEELRRARALARDLGGTVRGTLRITAPVTFGHAWVVPLLPRLHADHPELHLDVMLTDAVVDLLKERVDAAIRIGPLAPSDFVARRLCPMTSVVCASPGYLEAHDRPRRPAELADHDCLLFPIQAYRRWRFRARGDQPGRKRGPTIEEVAVRGRCVVSTAFALRQCATGGMGLALLPRWVVADDLRAGSLVDVFPGHDVTATEFDNHVWMIYPSRTHLPLKVRVLAELLERELSGAPWEHPDDARAPRANNAAIGTPPSPSLPRRPRSRSGT